MNRMHTLVNHDTGHQAAAVQATPEMTWFKETRRIHLRLHHASRSPHHKSQSHLHRLRRTHRIPPNQGHRRHRLLNKRHRFGTANAAKKHHNRGRRLHRHGVWTLLLSDRHQNHSYTASRPGAAGRGTRNL